MLREGNSGQERECEESRGSGGGGRVGVAESERQSSSARRGTAGAGHAIKEEHEGDAGGCSACLTGMGRRMHRDGIAGAWSEVRPRWGPSRVQASESLAGPGQDGSSLIITLALSAELMRMMAGRGGGGGGGGGGGMCCATRASVCLPPSLLITAVQNSAGRSPSPRRHSASRIGSQRHPLQQQQECGIPVPSARCPGSVAWLPGRDGRPTTGPAAVYFLAPSATVQGSHSAGWLNLNFLRLLVCLAVHGVGHLRSGTRKCSQVMSRHESY